MTDPSSASRRRRRRSGRHQEPVRRAASTPTPPDEARRNRESAFGATNPRRTWPGGSSAASAESAASTASAAPAESADPADLASPAPVSATPSATPAPLPSPSSDTAPHNASAPDPSRPASASADAPPRRPRGRRAAFALPEAGSAAASGESPSLDEDTATYDAWHTDPSAPDQEPTTSGVAPHTDAEPATPGDDAPAPTMALSPVPPSPSSGQGTPTVVSGASAVAAADGAEFGGTGSGGAGSGGAGSGGAGSGGSGPSDGDSSDDASDEASEIAGSDGPPASGSLRSVAMWTVLTALLPGSGLVTTRLRRLGWVLLAVLGLTALTVAALLVVGDPLRAGMMLLTSRSALIGIMIAAGVVGLVWVVQIVIANRAHTTRQRLAGTKRYLAMALAAVMVVAVALPFGRGVQSLWATQGLLGSETVFSLGGEDRDHPFVEGKDPWAGTERVNIMLLGQDSGVDRTGTRPDTIMMASIDTKTGQTALFSIPRNLEKVHFPEGTVAAEEFPDGFDYFGKNQDLINAVWTWAEDRPDLFPGDPNPGLTATTWAVEETLGLESDYYAMVNLQGFEDLVNAIGGVNLVVERRIPIGGGVNQATGGSYPVTGHIEAGDQKLDGFNALWYARSREGSNDFNRMCRQQRMVRAVTEEADPTTLALSIPRLVTATEENIQTDIPVSDLDAFVDLALRVKEGGFTSYPITPDVTSTSDPDWDYLKDWTAASIEDSMKQESPESVVGETEPGSTDPAATGASDSGDGDDASSEPTAEAPEGTEESEESTEEKPSTEPEIDQDPLKSCLPGAVQD